MTSDEDRSNLRDLHAGFALVGLLYRGDLNDMDAFPALAYRLADMMQEARDRHSVGIVSIKRQTKKEKANDPQ
jgi:hypothetical protein